MKLFNPKYIFDSGPFIDLNNYPKDVFEKLWVNLNEMLKDGEIISSTEVYREIESYNDDFIADWAKENKKYFLKPTIEDQLIVQEILKTHPELVKKSNLLTGKAVADPFVIAQAKVHKCILVHQEKYKPNAHNIPNVCEALEVSEISLFDFFRKEKWKF